MQSNKTDAELLEYARKCAINFEGSLDRFYTSEALMHAIAFFDWQIEQMKSNDPEAMTDRELKLHTRKIDQYTNFKESLERLLERI